MIFNPLYILYRKGPYINGLGFWEGRSNEEICSILTNTKNEIWLKNRVKQLNSFSSLELWKIEFAYNSSEIAKLQFLQF